MTDKTLSQKLFVQPDGKKFAYADEIRKAIKKLKEKLRNFYGEDSGWLKEIDEIFGEELSKCAKEWDIVQDAKNIETKEQ